MSIKAPPVGYIDMLDKAQKDAYEENNTRSYTPIRPSAAGKCETALAYEYLEYTGALPYTSEGREPNVIRLLGLGHSIEFSMMRDMQALKSKYGLNLVYKQQTVICGKIKDKEGNDMFIQGSSDFGIVNKEGTFKTLCDAKSAKDNFSTSHKTRFDEDLEKFSQMETLQHISNLCFYAEDVEAFLKELGPHFKAHNVVQLNYYACSPFYKTLGFDNCSLFYYNKNDSRIFEIRFKPSQDLADRTTKKFQAAVLAEDPQIDCKKDFQVGSIVCAYCPYNDKCWNKDALKAYFDTYPKKKWATDSSKLADNIEVLYNEFMSHDVKKKDLLEKQICAILEEAKVNKVRFSDGKIFNMKILKTKGLVLREGKN